MPLPRNFPQSPHDILDPDARWYPGEEQLEGMPIDHLLPPLVHELRKQVKIWRDKGYEGASDTSRSLLRWWFGEERMAPGADEFRYYFAQREAVETIIYLYEVVGVKGKYDLIRVTHADELKPSLFPEDWRRFVVKMATGSGKTKVLSLVLAWSFFHRLYEPDSSLARNFLIIAPNIIVLDRLKRDFDGLRIFNADPVLPDNGYDGRDWRNDFQLIVHIQDDVRVARPVGNIFLTNIHRVYTSNDVIPSPDDDDTTDYFLGKQPTGSTTDSKTDLGAIVRDIDELTVLNDEAHHIHDERLAWFKCIEDIHNQLKQKGSELALQIDTTATPRHNNGAIFVQTVTDYPLVEAIAQNIVKRPVLPDDSSRAKLKEHPSVRYSERYEDYLNLGVVEWRKATKEHEKTDKKPILFVMTDDTKNCDEVADYLEHRYHDLEEAILVIHTRRDGEISEPKSKQARQKLDELRKLANEIDEADNKYKVIVSVLVLKEGWDVRNVTTVVGLRAYSAKSNILPEQTLGRGLRRMYPEDDTEEEVSVIGTDAFVDFVSSLQTEGVVLERKPMGAEAGGAASMTIEINREHERFEQMDIELPKLSPRNYRQYDRLDELDPACFGHRKIPYKEFSPEEQREIVFRDLATNEVSHTTTLDASGVADWRNVIGYFARTLIRDLRLVSSYDKLYGEIKEFVHRHMFDREVHLETANTLRNLAEPSATKALIEAFTQAINDLTVQDKGSAEITEHIRVSEMRSFRANRQKSVTPRKSILNKIIADNKSSLELDFAVFLDQCDDIIAYAKNYFAIGFKLDYVKRDGGLSTYTPDFIVKASEGRLFVIETKGLEDLDVPKKMERLKQWCDDANEAQSAVVFDFVYVDETGFRKYTPKSFADLVASFREYKDASV